jgi:hypothetical protein
MAGRAHGRGERAADLAVSAAVITVAGCKVPSDHDRRQARPFLHEREKIVMKATCFASDDRPLRNLPPRSAQIFPSRPDQKPVDVAHRAVEEAETLRMLIRHRGACTSMRP